MFAFPEQLQAEIDAFRELTRAFPHLPTMINTKLRQQSGSERERKCVRLYRFMGIILKVTTI